MKNKTLISSLIIAAITLPIAAHADDSKPFTIVNHYNKTLNYTVGINPQVLQDLPETFSLSPTESISARILNQGKEAYIRVNDGGEPKPNSAFWGLELVNDQIKFHGYLGKGIAYSWKGQTITFCTPEDYKKNHSCL